MSRRCLAGGLILLTLGAAPPGSAPDQELITPDAVKWADGPASLPAGAKVAVLEGDPARDGPFVLRVRLPDGMRILPHTHPRDERVTVLSGTLHLGAGKAFDPAAAKPLKAGSYGRTRAGVPHFGWAEGETVLQLHGTGPWAVEYVRPGDDPRAKK